MVVVNIIASVILISIFLFYRFVYPKKNPPYVLMLFLLSLLPLISLLRKGSYESGDLSLHSTRFLSFYNSLEAGILLPQWSHDLNAGYGYPLFIFVQTFPNYIASFFHFLGISMISSIKLIFALSFIASGIGMYYYLKLHFKPLIAFAGAVLYLFAPYHFVNMHFRANPGEVLSTALLPFCTLAIYKLSKTKNLFWFSICSILISFIILAHPIAIVIAPFFLLYIIFLSYKDKNINIFVICMLSLTLGALLSAFYWLPSIYEGSYTHQSYYHAEVLFTSLKELIYSPWRFGMLYQGHYGELSFLLGYAQILLVIAALYFLFKKKYDLKQRRYLYFYLFVFFFSIFAILEVSKPLWNIFFIFHNLQFSYRILVLTTFVIAVIGAFAFEKIKNKWIFTAIVFFTIFGTILNWGNRRVIPEITDSVIKSQIPYASKGVEGSAPSTPIWLDAEKPWQENPRNEDVSKIRGEYEYKTLKRSPTKHIYLINVLKESEINSNTVYFPGWRVYSNGNIIETDITKNGLFSFKLKEGLHKVEISFEATHDRKYSQIISFLSILLIIFIFLYIFIRKIRK